MLNVGEALLGRGRECARLVEILDAGGTAAVVGPAGIGKTALVRTVLGSRDHALGAGLSLLRQRPYAPLESALQVRLTGDVDDVADTVAACVDGALVVEDLHWAHELTIEVLDRLIGALPIVVTARSEVSDAARSLLDRCETLQLAPLSPTAAERLARRIHPGIGDTERGELLRLAGGNPLLLERLVDRVEAVSPTLEAAVADRLVALPPHVQRPLGLLALLGRPASSDLLGDVAELPHDLVDQRDGLVTLRHDALAQGIVALLDDDERRSLHAELADRLDDGEGAAHALAGGQPDHARARALRAAEEVTNVVERAELLCLVADAAAAAGDDPSALRARAASALVDGGRWRTAITEANRVSTDDPLIASDAALAEGRARWCIGQVEDARHLLAIASELVTGVDPKRSARVAVERAHLEVRDQVAGCLDVAAEAVAVAEALGADVLRARATHGAAQLYAGHPDWEATLRTALDAAMTSGDLELEASIAYHLVSGLGFHGRFAEAVTIDRSEIDRTRTAGLGRWTTHFEGASLIHRLQAEVDLEAVATDAERFLNRHPLFRNRFQVHLTRAAALLELGRLEAAALAIDAFDAEVAGSAESVASLALARAELAWHLDDPDLAEDALRSGRVVADAYFGIHVLTECTAAHVLHWHGRPVAPQLPTSSMPAWWPALHEIEGLRLLGQGNREGGVSKLDLAASHWESMGVTRWAVRAGMAATEARADRSAPSRRRHWIELARGARSVGTLRRLGVPVNPALTLTEEAVLRQVATGATSREVSVALGIAPTTVDQHVEAARRKLGAATRLEAAMRVDR